MDTCDSELHSQRKRWKGQKRKPPRPTLEKTKGCRKGSSLTDVKDVTLLAHVQTRVNDDWLGPIIPAKSQPHGQCR
jgi:hypothetical protein